MGELRAQSAHSVLIKTLLDVQQLLLFESFGGFGRGVREILWKAADVLQNKLTRAQYHEVTWTTKNWLGLQKQRISVVLHTHGNRRADCE